MKKKDEIIRVPILPLDMVNAFIIKSSQGCIAVDTGLPNSEKKFARVLKKNNLNFKDIKLIIVTHAHVDHAGSAVALRELSKAPIVAHSGDLAHLQQKETMTFCSTGWFGNLFLKTKLMIEPYQGFTPDILLNNSETLSLEKYGIDGLIVPTIGHTSGSITIKLDSGVALVGDLIASGILLGGIIRKGSPKRPPFEDSPQLVAKALQQLVESGVEKFYMGHGGPLSAAEVKKHADTLAYLKNSSQVQVTEI